MRDVLKPLKCVEVDQKSIIKIDAFATEGARVATSAPLTLQGELPRRAGIIPDLEGVAFIRLFGVCDEKTYFVDGFRRYTVIVFVLAVYVFRQAFRAVIWDSVGDVNQTRKTPIR